LQVYVNGEYKELSDGLSLLDLLNILNLPIQRIAVELNRSVVRRAEWERTQLKDDDRVRSFTLSEAVPSVASERK